VRYVNLEYTLNGEKQTARRMIGGRAAEQNRAVIDGPMGARFKT
jgi:hypothetical protein